MRCDLGDVSIFYESFGAGRPIVMLPGQPSDHHVMTRLMEPLFAEREGWLRIYPDLPGTGQSSASERIAAPDHVLAAMLAFIDKVIPGQRFTLAGLSYGGYVARGVVHERAASIDGLLLVVPMVKSDSAQAQLPLRTPLVENAALMEGLGPVGSLVVVQTQPVVDAARQVLAEVQTANHAFLDRIEAAGPYTFDVDTLPAPLQAPALVLTARQDFICGYRDAWELLDNYPRATFATLDRAGHFVDLEQNALCHALIREWLDRVEESAPAERPRAS